MPPNKVRVCFNEGKLPVLVPCEPLKPNYCCLSKIRVANTEVKEKFHSPKYVNMYIKILKTKKCSPCGYKEDYKI